MNRTIAPKISLPKKLNFGNVDKIKLDNDFPIYSVSGASQDIFQMTIVFRAGRFFENKKMIASLCANMILKGTKNKSAYEIAETFDFYGATVKYSANMYTAQLSLYCLTKELPNLLPLLIEIFNEASFPEKELKKAKAKLKQKIAIQWEKNAFIASQHFNQAIFGINHPFGYFTQSNIIDDITREDLKEHFEKHFQLNKDAFGIIAGNINEPELNLINKYIGSLKIIDKENKSAVMSPVANKEIFIDAKNKLQAAIRVGQPTINIHHPDFGDLQILNTILGGYFGSRLMSNIREDKGYTYGIYSFINPIMDSGYFCIATDVGEQYKKQTLNEIEIELNRLKNEEVSNDELSMVKNYMIGQLMKSVDGPLSMASTLKNFLIFDLDLSEINKQLEAIHQIKANRIKELANQHFNFEEMYKVVVG